MGTIRRVTDAQVKELRKWLHQRASLSKAAMKTDMDRKSARKYRDLGQLPSEARQPRDWRTREDPLAAVWPELEEQLRREPGLQAVTLLAWLQSAYPEKFRLRCVGRWSGACGVGRRSMVPPRRSTLRRC